MSAEPAPLCDAIAEVSALFPITSERAAANARLLEEEVAAYEAEHADEETEPCRMTPVIQDHREERA